MGTVNLSLSELVTGGPGMDAMHEAHHVHHHQIPGADLQPDEETAEDEVNVPLRPIFLLLSPVSAAAQASGSCPLFHTLPRTLRGWTLKGFCMRGCCLAKQHQHLARHVYSVRMITELLCSN